MASRYTDVSFSFKKHPITNDLEVKNNNESIKQSLKNLCLLKPYDVPMHPEIFGIGDMLFEPIDSVSTFQMKQRLRTLIENYEPRIELEDIEIDEQPNANGITIIFKYYIVNTNQLESSTIYIDRIR